MENQKHRVHDVLVSIDINSEYLGEAWQHLSPGMCVRNHQVLHLLVLLFASTLLPGLYHPSIAAVIVGFCPLPVLKSDQESGLALTV